MSRKDHIDENGSVMPGATNKGVNHVDSDDNGDEVQASPVIGNIKHGVPYISSTPEKKKKSDSVQSEFKGLVDHHTSESDLMTSITGSNSETYNNDVTTLAREIEVIMDKVVECGAPEGSDEYYMATKLFGRSIHRCFFNIMKTSEGRLDWLKRHYANRKMH